MSRLVAPSFDGIFESEVLSMRYPVGFSMEESDGGIGTNQTFRGPFLSLDRKTFVPVQRSESWGSRRVDISTDTVDRAQDGRLLVKR